VRLYTISSYDIADDPGKDGDWTKVAENVPLDKAREAYDGLFCAGYCSLSICVDTEDDRDIDLDNEH
jgi:hypothetical protein